MSLNQREIRSKYLMNHNIYFYFKQQFYTSLNKDFLFSFTFLFIS